jgi:RNA polymerase sigma-70 factor (ECF subfamily)
MTCTEVPGAGPLGGVALRSDPAAFEALYRQHGPALRQLCRKRLGNAVDAEDACHEAMLRAWSSLDRYDPSRPMWPWLATIAGNVCLDLQRRSRLAESRRAPSDPVPMSPDEVAVNGERDVVVREALALLPTSSRTVLFLRDVEGWSYTRIGRFEGRSAPAVRTAVARARHQLRTEVEAVARASGRWPLPAVLALLWARARRQARRVRAGTTDLATRSVSLVDGSTGLVGTLGSSAAAQVVCSALLMGSVVTAVGLVGSTASTASAASTAQGRPHPVVTASAGDHQAASPRASAHEITGRVAHGPGTSILSVEEAAVPTAALPEPPGAQAPALDIVEVPAVAVPDGVVLMPEPSVADADADAGGTVTETLGALPEAPTVVVADSVASVSEPDLADAPAVGDVDGALSEPLDALPELAAPPPPDLLSL